jgi:hypothetical protein
MLCPRMQVQVSSLHQLLFADGFMSRQNQHHDLSFLQEHCIDFWKMEYPQVDGRCFGVTLVKDVSNF